MSKITAAVLIIVAVTVCQAPLLQAKTNADDPKSPHRSTKTLTLVKAVDLTAKTITIQTGTDDPVTYTFTPLTRVTVDGKAVKIDDVKVDMKVSIISTMKLVDQIDAVTVPSSATHSSQKPTKK